MANDLSDLRIIHHPDPRLRAKCPPVAEFDDSLADLAQRMLELMREANGIGLAAPQVGVLLRLFVCNTTGEPEDDLVFVNPELSAFEGDEVAEEGCLSLPDVTVNVRRAARCRVRAQDLEGKAFACEGIDLAARCWQHENDHLDGRLIIDLMSEGDKIANRRALKNMEAAYRR